MSDHTPPARSRWPGTLVWLAVLVSLHVTRGVLLLLVVPGFKKTYDEYNLQLPAATKWLVMLSNWWCKSWYYAGPLSLLLMVGGVMLGRHVFRRTSPGNVFAAVYLFVLVGTMLFAAVGLVMPQLKLVEGLSK
jgi:type II secretory pathway component PulF